jgi:hypothetical protein
VTAFCRNGHPQSAAVSAVDGAVRTPGRGSAALPDTGHCPQPSRRRCWTWPPLLSAQAAGVALPGDADHAHRICMLPHVPAQIQARQPRRLARPHPQDRAGARHEIYCLTAPGA